MCEVDSYNDCTKGKQKAGNQKKQVKQTRKGTDEKEEGKERKDEITKKEKRGKRTIAIATAVFLPSGNKCWMSDASSWY